MRISSRRIAAVLENRENELWLSPVSVGELLLLAAKRRLVLGEEPTAWVARALATAPLKEAPLTFEVALETVKVALPHRDPADRFLAATARVFELTLITADERLIGIRGLSVLANR